MKSSRFSNTAVFKAVQQLDPEAVSFHLLDPLTEEQIDNLLTVADRAIMVEMRAAAAGIGDVPPHEFVDYAAEHSRVLLKYLSVRAILCGDTHEDDDCSDLGVF